MFEGKGGEYYMWPRRTHVEVEEMVRDAYVYTNEIHTTTIESDGEALEVLGGQDNNNENVHMANLDNLICESIEPIYEGCGVNRLQALIMLMNMVNIYNVPHIFLDELLRFLATNLLP